MTAFRFDCVFYYVRDLDRAVAFYRDVLGLSLASRDAVARFDLDGVLFELVPTDDALLLAGRGNARLTLAVEDLEGARRWLHEKGVRTTDVRTVANGRLLAAYDPEGNELVVWEGA